MSKLNSVFLYGLFLTCFMAMSVSAFADDGIENTNLLPLQLNISEGAEYFSNQSQLYLKISGCHWVTIKGKHVYICD